MLCYPCRAIELWVFSWARRNARTASSRAAASESVRSSDMIFSNRFRHQFPKTLQAARKRPATATSLFRFIRAAISATHKPCKCFNSTASRWSARVGAPARLPAKSISRRAVSASLANRLSRLKGLLIRADFLKEDIPALGMVVRNHILYIVERACGPAPNCPSLPLKCYPMLAGLPIACHVPGPKDPFLPTEMPAISRARAAQTMLDAPPIAPVQRMPLALPIKGEKRTPIDRARELTIQRIVRRNQFRSKQKAVGER